MKTKGLDVLFDLSFFTMAFTFSCIVLCLDYIHSPYMYIPMVDIIT